MQIPDDVHGFVQNGEGFCPDCALHTLFLGDEDAIQAVFDGRDTTFVDLSGESYELIHDATISFEQDPERDYFPEGLYCSVGDCGAEIVSPVDLD